MGAVRVGQPGDGPNGRVERRRLYLTAKVPTLIIWGARDGIIPVDHAYATHQDLPGSRLEVIEGAGHFFHVEAPGRFAEILADFVQTMKAAQGRPDDLVAMLREGSPGS